MIFTDRSCGSTNFWMSHQRVPACTRIVRSPGENDSTRFIVRMSKCRLPGLAVWPPMLKRPPPMDTGPLVRRIASCTSSTEVGATMAITRTGFSCVTSLTMRWLVMVAFGSHGSVVGANAGGRAMALRAVARAQEGAIDDQYQRARDGHGGEQQPPGGAAAIVQATAPDGDEEQRRQRRGDESDGRPDQGVGADAQEQADRQAHEMAQPEAGAAEPAGGGQFIPGAHPASPLCVGFYAEAGAARERLTRAVGPS